MTTEDEATLPPGWVLHSIDGGPPQLMLVLAVDTRAEADAAMAELAAPFVAAFAKRVFEWATRSTGVGMRTAADREYHDARDAILKQRWGSLRAVSDDDDVEETLLQTQLPNELDWKFGRMLEMANEPPQTE